MVLTEKDWLIFLINSTKCHGAIVDEDEPVADDDDDDDVAVDVDVDETVDDNPDF